MAGDAFLHGVAITEDDSGPRPISTSDASVIGLVGTAVTVSKIIKNNIPYLVNQRSKGVELFGPIADDLKSVSADNTIQVPTENTIPYALAAIFDQTGANVVVVKAASASEADIKTAINALKTAESVVGKAPRIIIAPGLVDSTVTIKKNQPSFNSGIIGDLTTAAKQLRGIAIIDGPNTVKQEDAITASKLISKERAYLVYPWVTVSVSENVTRVEPPSSRIAGVIVMSDSERGFWWSPSNRPIAGISGTTNPIDFTMGDGTSSANTLNENNVATIIFQNGYRLWGNRGCGADVKWQFISVRRTADMINDSLQRAHLWAVDRCITRTYVADVTEAVNAYLRHLKSIGAIIDGKCWADPAKNTWDQIQDGKITFDFDFSPPYPAEHITFNSKLVNNYLEEIFT